MSELKLILKKLDQISNRLDLLEKKIETPERKKSTPETPPNKVEEWKISQEFMNREKDNSDWESNIDEYIQNYQTDVGNLGHTTTHWEVLKCPTHSVHKDGSIW